VLSEHSRYGNELLQFTYTGGLGVGGPSFYCLHFFSSDLCKTILQLSLGFKKDHVVFS
jgi:hypothetical protein